MSSVVRFPSERGRLCDLRAGAKGGGDGLEHRTPRLGSVRPRGSASPRLNKCPRSVVGWSLGLRFLGCAEGFLDGPDIRCAPGS